MSKKKQKRRKRRIGDPLPGNRKEWLPRNSTGRGYGSKRQDRRADAKTEWANKNPDKLLSPEELVAENKRREQEAIQARFQR